VVEVVKFELRVVLVVVVTVVVFVDGKVANWMSVPFPSHRS
jgi:hypothetical protein